MTGHCMRVDLLSSFRDLERAGTSRRGYPRSVGIVVEEMRICLFRPLRNYHLMSQQCRLLTPVESRLNGNKIVDHHLLSSAFS